jgi:hypothetical protein
MTNVTQRLEAKSKPARFGSVIPFTLIVILPTNKRLLDTALVTRGGSLAAPLGAAAFGPLGGEWNRVHHDSG